jgi:hypothetical protein
VDEVNDNPIESEDRRNVRQIAEKFKRKFLENWARSLSLLTWIPRVIPSPSFPSSLVIREPDGDDRFMDSLDNGGWKLADLPTARAHRSIRIGRRARGKTHPSAAAVAAHLLREISKANSTTIFRERRKSPNLFAAMHAA